MRGSVFGIMMMGLILSGCEGGGELAGPGPKPSGRYTGIGTYPAGQLWGQMAGIKPPDDPASARIGDDEQIIVTIDSHSGEVRQCGDRSGHCVAINPWRGTNAPVKLNQHAADLVAENEAVAASETTAQ